MRTIILFFFLVFAVPGFSLAEQWQEVKGDHFIIRYLASTVRPGTAEYPGEIGRFAGDVAVRAEGYYRRIAGDLGYSRSSEFWTWDKRVKIIIYPDHGAYIASSGHPEWSHGMADYGNKEISSYAFSRDFLDSILPHELAHLIFRDFVGFKGEVPRWLDEGVAQWEEEAKREQAKLIVGELYAKGALFSVVEMMKINLNAVKKTDGLYIRSIITRKGSRNVLFLTGDNIVNTYYVQSVSLVGFLIERYGAGDFAHFCRQLRDGKSLEDALGTVYPLTIRNLEEFEEEWRTYLIEKYGN